MSLSNDELRAAIMVLHSSTSTTTARIAAHESVMHFEHSVVAWASALHLVQSSQSFYGIYGASILATKAKRGDYVEDRHALVIAILSVLGSIPEFQRSLRCQDETMSVQAELVIAVAAIAAPAPAMLDLLDLPAFQTLKPITALAVLEHMGSADGMSKIAMSRARKLPSRGTRRDNEGLEVEVQCDLGEGKRRGVTPASNSAQQAQERRQIGARTDMRALSA